MHNSKVKMGYLSIVDMCRCTKYHLMKGLCGCAVARGVAILAGERVSWDKGGRNDEKLNSCQEPATIRTALPTREGHNIICFSLL